MDVLDLGYSFCPNDTFIFYALTHGKIPFPLQIRECLEDVETLNNWAMEARLAMTKVSYRAFGSLRDRYVALRSGGALGRGVGPLVVSRTKLNSLSGLSVASPGQLTTAELLLKCVEPKACVVHMRYDEILPAVQSGEVDAGLIIHESRFVYPSLGLHKFIDLGTWWEELTGLPLPLGVILVRRDLDPQLQKALNEAVRASLRYAWEHPEETRAYIRQHALEYADEVIQAHIDLYVNGFSLDIGSEGEEAVRVLLSKAEELGVIAPSSQPLFVEN
ncbi:MAG: 1,4-dihydroxy-6-naphthoate synthase [Deinococcaceae bacterium]